MKRLYKFHIGYGRMGDLDGLFIADDEEVKNIIGKEVYFGEVLGKHSDIYDTMDEEMFTALDISPRSLKTLESVLGTTWSGFNPVEIAKEDE